MSSKNAKVVSLKRALAASFIDEVREIIASAEEQGSEEYVYENLCDAMKKLKLPALKPCTGAAHDPEDDGCGNIDNCNLCAPRWGFMGAKVKVT